MALFLFEFMDHPQAPRVIRETLLDVLDYCNTDFRPYYRDLAHQISRIADTRGLTTIVELGAGAAPLTRELAKLGRPERQLVPCDLFPENEAWQALQTEYPDTVAPVYEPVDFTKPRPWGANSCVVLCATLHHIPQPVRESTLLALHDSAECVLIFEPVRKTPWSMFLVLFAIIPALLTPVFRIRQPGRFRRFLLCWLFPIIPIMFVWDGLVSCVRQWSHHEWLKFADSLPDDHRVPQVQSALHSQTVAW